MTMREIGARLHLSASGVRALIKREGWQPIGTSRHARTGPEEIEYAAADVEAYAVREADALRERAALLDPKEG